MINPFANIGTQFYISSVIPSTLDGLSFAALTWTQIRGCRSIGDIGEIYELREVNEIGQFRKNIRTSKLATSIPIELIKITDAGQGILQEAFKSTNQYSFRVIAADQTIFYFTAEVSKWLNNSGEVNSIADIKSELQVSSSIIEV